MTDTIEVDFQPARKLRHAIATFEQECATAGGYMPSLATLLRIYADELADKYPDDANGGRQALGGPIDPGE